MGFFLSRILIVSAMYLLDNEATSAQIPGPGSVRKHPGVDGRAGHSALTTEVHRHDGPCVSGTRDSARAGIHS